MRGSKSTSPPQAPAIDAGSGTLKPSKTNALWEDKGRRLQELLALPPRRAEVLALLHDGEPDKVIAGKLHITPNTLHAYLAILFAGLGVKSRGLAMLSAERVLAQRGRRKPIR